MLAETEWVTVLAALGALAVTVGGALTTWYLKILSARTAENRQVHKDTVAELYEILEVQRRDRIEDRALINGLRDDLHRVQVKLTVCEKEREDLTERVEALEQGGKGWVGS